MTFITILNGVHLGIQLTTVYQFGTINTWGLLAVIASSITLGAIFHRSFNE